MLIKSAQCRAKVLKIWMQSSLDFRTPSTPFSGVGGVYGSMRASGMPVCSPSHSLRRYDRCLRASQTRGGSDRPVLMGGSGHLALLRWHARRRIQK